MYDRDTIDDHIDRFGFSMPTVLGERPDSPTWAHTVGLARAGLPELIVFGVSDDDVLSCIFEDVRHQLLDRPDLARPGRTLDVEHLRRPVRLGAVAPRWRDTYPLWAIEYGGRDIEVLQLVIADDDGRLPGDPAFTIDALLHQPLLSYDDQAWRAPLFPASYPEDDLATDVLVLVPILHAGQPELRDEVVPAELLADDRARLLQPPLLADWVTAGTEVRLTDPPDVYDELDVPLLVGMAEVTRVSPMTHLSYTLHDHEGDHAEGSRRVERELERFDAIVTHGRCSVSIALAAVDGTRARLALRRLERDGIVSADEPYHRPDVVRHDPRCVGCRRELQRGA